METPSKEELEFLLKEYYLWEDLIEKNLEKD